MLDALIAGQRDPQVLADMAKGRMRSKIPNLQQAMIGRFATHHAFLCRMHLDRIDQLTRDIDKLSERIDQVVEPFRGKLTRMDTVPGISVRIAEVVLAETGGDMTRFPTAGHLAS